MTTMRTMAMVAAATLTLCAQHAAAGYSGLIKEAPVHYDAHTAAQENPPGDVIPANVMAPLCAEVVPGKNEGRQQCQVDTVFDRNLADLQSIYQIALKEHPEMKGAIVVRLVIFADGTVTRCDLLSSELNEPDTEKKLVDRIKATNFGAIEGNQNWEGDYTLHFPSRPTTPR